MFDEKTPVSATIIGITNGTVGDLPYSIFLPLPRLLQGKQVLF